MVCIPHLSIGHTLRERLLHSALKWLKQFSRSLPHNCGQVGLGNIHVFHKYFQFCMQLVKLDLRGSQYSRRIRKRKPSYRPWTLNRHHYR